MLRYFLCILYIPISWMSILEVNCGTMYYDFATESYDDESDKQILSLPQPMNSTPNEPTSSALLTNSLIPISGVSMLTDMSTS